MVNNSGWKVKVCQFLEEIYYDLYIRIVTQVPTSLSKRQKEILEEFNEIETNKPDPVIKTFFEKAKKFWKKNLN